MTSRVRSGETGRTTMSEAEQAEEANDDDEEQSAEPELTKTEFFDRIVLEGVTQDGSFYMPHGTGRQRRYFEYDAGIVKGFDAVREDGEVVAQHVANHDEAKMEQIDKDHIEDVVYPKLRDGFGSFGPVVTESAKDEGDAPSGGAPSTEEFEPINDEELEEVIRENFAEHGPFREDDEGEEKVTSLPHPDARPMGYITGSHVKSLPTESLDTVDDYRQAVYEALATSDDGGPVFAAPGDVPICTDDMMEKFTHHGNSLDEETRDKISRQVKRRWEDGEYDHLRTTEADPDDADGGD